ncbi:TonB-dependent receptor domain-containing protein [Gaetbulibacter aestuarii]|uniref:TonB-dependent receptor n=1 Tax=Gaetbulibacter aestuarii TaxID=1502358 RepID=A0ABW7N3F4_9FLAO
MSTKNIFSLLFIVLTAFYGYATEPDKNITIKGTVIDAETKAPLEFATVSIRNHDDQKVIDGVITDASGAFKMRVAQGIYDIKVEYISYKSITFEDRTINENTDLGVIALALNVESLNAVEIVAERTTVEIKLDKKIYNIGKDLTTAGGTVSDALNNVPSVAVDIEGNISLRGNGNVKILINGKPSAMAGFGNTNILSQLPAEAIERVEVITSPSARYDAEGTAGILNIILRQKETLGFNGSINLTLGNPDNLGFSSNINYRTEKFNIFSNIGYRYFDAPRTNYNDTRYFERTVNGSTVTPEFERITENERVSRLNRNYNANLGMEYFLSDKTSVTGSLFYRYGEDADLGINTSSRYNGGSMVEQTNRREKQDETGNNYQISLNYITKFDDSGHQLTADFQYETRNENQDNFINEDYVFTDQTYPDPFQNEIIYQTEDRKEYLIQSDYVLPIGEDSRFEAGFRGRYQNEITDYLLEQEDINTGNYVVNEAITNIFDYSENVTAFYSQYGSKFGQFSFLLGLRLENTQLKGNIDSRLTPAELQEAFGYPIDTDFDNNYLGLFPTVNFIYNLSSNEDDPEESVTLGFNRRINRPRGWYISPYPRRSSRTNVFQGNPNLRPAYSSTFDLGYLKRWDELTVTASVYYQHETASFERIQENTGQQTSDGIDIIRTIPVNLSTNKRTGGEFGILYNPAKWIRLNSSFNIFQFETEGSFNNVDYGAKNSSWFTRFSSKVTLPGAIDWQTNAYYSGARQDAQSSQKGVFVMDLAFSKEVLNDKLTISLNARDLFNSRKRRTTTTTAFFTNYEVSQWRQRQVNLSFLYRFNQPQSKRERSGQDEGPEANFDIDG